VEIGGLGLGLGKPRSRALCPGRGLVHAVHGREYGKCGGRAGETQEIPGGEGKKKKENGQGEAISWGVRA